MSRLTLYDYLPGDEALVTLRPDFARAYASQDRVLPLGPAWSVREGRQVLAVGGLEPCGEGRWGGWALAADLTARQWAQVRRLVTGLLADLERPPLSYLAVRAIGATTPCDRPGAAGLLARLGFAVDGAPWQAPDGERYQPMTWRA